VACLQARRSLKSLALVAGLFTLGQAYSAPVAPENPDCLAQTIDIEEKVSIVYDGDTFLMGNQYVRLTGVHVPSSSQHLEPPEPLGKAVSQAVGELVSRSKGMLKIEYDQLKSEKGKIFVHAYLADGRNLAKVLLENGFALVDTRLPNTRHALCYREAEAKARAEKKGLWQYADKGVPLIESKDLTGDRIGFQVVRGKVVLAKQGKDFFILNMDTIGFRISKEAMAQFNERDLLALEGKVVEIRDNLAYFKGTMFSMLEHPGQINLLADKFYAEQAKLASKSSKNKP
jgi:endonuclease YncB( thermonuclease family)